MKPVVIPLFALRHIATGEFMPETRNGRGYSHWSPVQLDGAPYNVRTHKGGGEHAVRLFQSEIAARNARSQWARGVVDVSRGYGLGDGDELKVRDVGRQAADLEIVEFVAVQRCDIMNQK